MEEGTAGGFDDAHAFALEILVGVKDIRAEDIMVVQQDLYPLDSEEAFDQAGIVRSKGVFHRFAAIEGFRHFVNSSLSQGSTDLLGDIQAAQRADPINALGLTHLLVIGEF